MFIKKKNILKETDSFVFSITFSKKEKTYSTGGVYSKTTMPIGTPSVRLYLKKMFLGITYYKFIIGVKFKHQIYKSMFSFAGNTPKQTPIEKLFKKPSEIGAMPIYYQKHSDDQYFVEYNNTLNTYNDLTWMVAYQLFWENDPSYKAFNLNDDIIVILNLLNIELNLNLYYAHAHTILNGNVAFKKEAYHISDEQEDHFYNMQMLDKRNFKIKSIINS